jgi:heat shock protein HslJ
MERWERELDRLRHVSLPPRARRRVDEGPAGDGMPPAPGRGQRVLAGVVAFAVFGAALVLASGILRQDDSPPIAPTPEPAVIRLIAGAQPEGTLTYRGAQAGLASESYCWDQGNGAQICADMAAPEPFTSGDYLVVPAWAPFALENPDRAEVELTIAPGNDPMRAGATTSLEELSDLGVGRHVLTVVAEWGGQVEPVTFHFALEIADTTVPAGDVLLATLRAPPDGSMPDLTLSYGGVSEGFFAQGGEWPGVNGFDEPLLHFTPVLPGLTELRIDGDADDVQASLEGVDEQDRLTGEKTPLDLSGGSASLPSGGSYQLEIWGSWDAGTAGYFVRIRIGEGVTPAPSPTPSVGPTPTPTVAPPSTSSTTPDPGLHLAGTSWELEGIDGQPIAAPQQGELGSVPTLIVGEDRLGGSTGCNSYGADWSVLDGVLRTSRIQMTWIGCGGSVGEVEQRFLAIIGGDPRVSIKDGILGLTTEAGVAILARIDVEHDDIVGSYLDCDPADHVAFTHGNDMYLQPGPPAYFTANMTGLKDGDEFVRFAGSADLAEESRWLVVRDGLVVAEVNYPALDGVACRYSGVQGA